MTVSGGVPCGGSGDEDTCNRRCSEVHGCVGHQGQ